MHIVAKKVYVGIFAALLFFTGLTVWVAYHNFGPWNVALALGIAVTKATLVILYFMHVRYSNRLTWIVVGTGFLWLGVLLALTLSDYFTRDWLPIYTLIRH